MGEREEDQLRLQKLLVKVRHVKDKMVQIKENKKKKEEEKKNNLKKENSSPKLKQNMRINLHPQNLIHIC